MQRRIDCRGWRALALPLFLFAYLAVAHHRVAVPHEVCAIDGEFGHGHAHAPADSLDERAPALDTSSGSSRGHAHEFCAMPFAGEERALPSRELRGSPSAPPPTERTVPALRAERHEPIARLRLAPKTSPPSAS